MKLRCRFWQWIHNCVAHPLEGWIVLFLGYCPSWVERFHDYSCERIWEEESQ